MPFSGTTFFPHGIMTGEGVNNRKFVTALPPADNSSTCNFSSGGTNNNVRYILIKPGVSGNTLPAPATAPGTTAEGFGWNFLRSDFNIDSTHAPGVRKIPAGNLTFNCVMEALTADTSTNFGIAVRVYRLNADGTYTHLASGETAGLSVIAGTADVDVTVNFATEQTFQNNESLHVEFWFKGRGGGSLGALQQLLTFHIGQPALRQAVNVVLPGVGLTTRYPRSHGVTATGTAEFAKLPNKKFSNTVTGSVTMAKLAMKQLNVTVTGSVTMRRMFPRLFVVTSTGSVKLLLLVPEVAIDRMEPGGGGGTVEVIKAPVLIFVEGAPAVRTGGKQYEKV